MIYYLWESPHLIALLSLLYLLQLSPWIPPSLVSAGNEPCPQPQTSEHLAAIEIMKLKHILILQNKIDLVKESQAHEQYDQILKFIQGKEHWLTLK